MNRTPTFKIAIIIFFILLFLIIPKDVVWGGQQNQTVPTVGPSRTPTTAFTATQLVATNTQIVNTQPASSNPTSTSTSQIILQSTETPSSEILESQSTTSIQTTSAIQQPEATQTAVSEATKSVSLPIVSGGDEKDQTSGSSDQELVTTIPSFVFPVIAVLLLVIVFLIFKLATKRNKEIK